MIYRLVDRKGYFYAGDGVEFHPEWSPHPLYSPSLRKAKGFWTKRGAAKVLGRIHPAHRGNFSVVGSWSLLLRKVRRVLTKGRRYRK